jgi:hypothetical protein
MFTVVHHKDTQLMNVINIEPHNVITQVFILGLCFILISFLTTKPS